MALREYTEGYLNRTLFEEKASKSLFILWILASTIISPLFSGSASPSPSYYADSYPFVPPEPVKSSGTSTGVQSSTAIVSNSGSQAMPISSGSSPPIVPGLPQTSVQPSISQAVAVSPGVANPSPPPAEPGKSESPVPLPVQPLMPNLPSQGLPVQSAAPSPGVQSESRSPIVQNIPVYPAVIVQAPASQSASPSPSNWPQPYIVFPSQQNNQNSYAKPIGICGNNICEHGEGAGGCAKDCGRQNHGQTPSSLGGAAPPAQGNAAGANSPARTSSVTPLSTNPSAGQSCTAGYYCFSSGIADSSVRINSSCTVEEVAACPSGCNNTIGRCNQAPAQSTAKGPVVHYQFNGDYRDSSGNNFHGTGNGAVIANEGVDGKAAKFSGFGYVSNPNFPWAGSGPASVMFWMKIGKAELQNSTAFAIGSSESPSRFSGSPWGDGALYWDYGNLTNGRLSADYKPYLDKWAHITLVSDGKNGAHKAIYINGALAAQDTVSSGPDDPLLGINVGRGFGSGRWQYYKGMIDEFAVYNTALPQTKIKEIYTNQKNRMAKSGPQASPSPPAIPPAKKTPAQNPSKLVWRQIPDISIIRTSRAQPQLVDLRQYVYDEREPFDNLTLFLGQSNPSLIECSIESKKYISCGTPERRDGENAINITVKNPGGNSITLSFKIKVKFIPNTPPRLNALPSVTVKANSGELRKFVDLQLYASDNETPSAELTFGIGQSNAALIACYVEEDKADKKRFVSCAAPAKNMGGTNAVTILARDEDGAETSASFTITVEGIANNAPVCRAEGIVFDEHDKSKQVTLKIGGSDADGDSIAGASVNWGDGVVNGLSKPSGFPMEMMHTYTGNANSYTINFTVTDSRGLKSNECTWPISFFPANPPQEPAAQVITPPQTIPIPQINPPAQTNACVSHANPTCVLGDAYWFDSCGNNEGLQQACGQDSCTDFGKNYCKGNSVYQSRSCNAQGCANGACHSNQTTEEKPVQECNQFTQTCEAGECKQRRNCNEEWVCENTKTSTYLRTDCSWGTREPCQFGCENGMCKPDPTKEYKPNSNYTCVTGDVYWFDYYGNRGKKKQECNTHTCNGNRCEGIDETCPNHNYYACSNGNVHWFNGCGTLQDKKETCNNGCYGTTCNTPAQTPSGTQTSGSKCTPNDHKACYLGDSWSFDSCGNKGSLNQDCEGKGCTDGACNSTYDSKDSDGDGFSDADEGLVGSDPSKPSITPFTILSNYKVAKALPNKSTLIGLLSLQQNNGGPVLKSTIPGANGIKKQGLIDTASQQCGFLQGAGVGAFQGASDTLSFILELQPLGGPTPIFSLNIIIFILTHWEEIQELKDKFDSFMGSLQNLDKIDQMAIWNNYMKGNAEEADNFMKNYPYLSLCTGDTGLGKSNFRMWYAVGKTFGYVTEMGAEGAATDAVLAGTKAGMISGRLAEIISKLPKQLKWGEEALKGISIMEKAAPGITDTLLGKGAKIVGQDLMEEGLSGLKKFENVSGSQDIAKSLGANIKSNAWGNVEDILVEIKHDKYLSERGYEFTRLGEEANPKIGGQTFGTDGMGQFNGQKFVHEAKNVNPANFGGNLAQVDEWIRGKDIVGKANGLKENMNTFSELRDVKTLVFTMPKNSMEHVFSNGEKFADKINKALTTEKYPFEIKLLAVE